MTNKVITSSFFAKDDSGTIYTVNVWTTVLSHLGRKIYGSSEYLLSNGDDLFAVSGHENQWEIAATNVRITRIEEE